MAAKAEVRPRPRPLKVDAINTSVNMGFWNALLSLKLDVVGTDDSPIPIAGQHPLLPLPVPPNCSDLGR